MTKKDIIAIFAIGAAIGVLIQPILANNLASFSLGIGFRFAIVIVMVIVAFLALWVACLLSRAWPPIYQFAKFAAVGTLNSVIDVGVFNGETFFYGMPAIGLAIFALFKAISFLCATTNSFFWNKSWTFTSGDHVGVKQAGSFYGIAALGWAVNVGVATFVKAIGPGAADPHAHLWTNLVAPLAGILASFILNFVGYKYFVFKRAEQRA